MKKYLFIAIALISVVAFKPAPKYANRAEAIAAQIHNPKSKYVVVVCHRGDWRNFPENSLPAIQSIIDMGADMMEMDLKMTKDSVLVLSHDKTLDRCTTGKGLISDYTYDELMKFRLKRAHGVAVDTIKMPTLRQALALCKDKICVNVDQGYEFYDQVLAITEELGVTDQILIKGRQPIDVVKAHEAKYSHNMMYMPIVSAGNDLFKSYIESGTVPLAYEVCWSEEDGTFEETAQQILAQGSKVWVNTIWASLCGGIGNDDDAAFQAADPAEVYDRYLKAGVSIMQTDRPEMLIKYLKKKGRHTLK